MRLFVFSELITNIKFVIMKKYFRTMILLACCSVAAMCFTTSCKDDDEDKETTEVVVDDEEENDATEDESDATEEKKDEKETEKEEETKVDNPAVVDGALIVASYKVSDTKSVYFSQGNLQFNAVQGTHAVYGVSTEVTGTWRFAENQYDFIGAANNLISSKYDGWIDLFGWGTSGWSSGVYSYNPYSTDSNDDTYSLGGEDATGAYANADWGVYNAISNGGNKPNMWRTLTSVEWQYLFKNNKWTLGRIEDRLCFMLIPETFSAPEGVNVEVLSTSATSYFVKELTFPSNNTYTADQFSALEQLGVVVLPCGGYREARNVYNVGTNGYYWSSSAAGNLMGEEFQFSASNVYSEAGSEGYYGCNVRLVKDIQ